MNRGATKKRPEQVRLITSGDTVRADPQALFDSDLTLLLERHQMPVTVRVVVEEVENGMKMRARSNKTGPVPIEGELDGYVIPAELKEKTPP